jgi:hypothetical protein
VKSIFGPSILAIMRNRSVDAIDLGKDQTIVSRHSGRTMVKTLDPSEVHIITGWYRLVQAQQRRMYSSLARSWLSLRMNGPTRKLGLGAR